MKNLIKIISVIIFGVIIITSCVKEEDPMFHSPSSSTSYLQFTTLNSVLAMTPADTLPIDITFGVKILGNPASSDLSIDLEILDETTVNTNTQVVLSSTTVVIAKNTYSGQVTMTVDPNEFDLSADTLKLFLKMKEGSLSLAQYGSNATFNFVYNVCPFDILNFLGGFKCFEVGYEEYDVTFSLDADVENRIHNTNFWDWAAPGATVYYDLSGDASQIVTIPDQPFTFGDGVVGSVDGTGTYDACTGTFSCDYNVWYDGGNNPTHHDFYRGGKASSIISTKKPEFLKN